MIAIDNTLISDEVVTEFFCCDIEKCKGCCCVKGNAGAPLADDEIVFLENNIDKIKPFMSIEGLLLLETQGFYEIIIDNTLATTCVNGAECVFAFYDGDIVRCAIEKAFEAGHISLRKPISCYLYPIRTRELSGGEALNYDRNDICKDAVALGKEKNIKVYEFLKPVLVEQYGEEWVKKLEATARHVERNTVGV